MTEVELKKWCYKNNPTATFAYIRKSVAYYVAWTGERNITIAVPVADMGDATFDKEMSAKFLLRWVLTDNTNQDAMVVCPRCDGEGFVEREEKDEVPCIKCDGRGKIKIKKP